MKKLDCDCEESEDGFVWLAEAVSFLDRHGIKYGGPIMVYCPWCGKKLEEITLGCSSAGKDEDTMDKKKNKIYDKDTHDIFTEKLRIISYSLTTLRSEETITEGTYNWLYGMITETLQYMYDLET